MNELLPAPESAPSSARRLRQSALELYGRQGVEGASVREIARRAGVAPGLVRHYFGSKEGLSLAVEESVLSLIRATLESVPLVGSPLEISAARDAALDDLLRKHPPLAAYLRQALARGHENEGGILDRLVDLTVEQTEQLIERGLDPRRGLRASVFSTVIRQLGRVVVDPTAERVWQRIEETVLGDSCSSGGVSGMPPRVMVTAVGYLPDTLAEELASSSLGMDAT